MLAAHASARLRTDRPHGSERKCIATGEVLPKSELIRFAVGPDRSVVPDLSHNLPGRGLWVKADRAAIETAAAKNLFAKAAKAPVKTGDGLANQVSALIHKRCLDLLGLARRSGIAVLGQPQVEAALKAGKIALLLIAGDASQTLDNKHNAPVARCFSRDELGAALGHDQLAYVGLAPHGLVEKLQAELLRLEKITIHVPQNDG